MSRFVQLSGFRPLIFEFSAAKRERKGDTPARFLWFGGLRFSKPNVPPPRKWEGTMQQCLRQRR